MPRRIVFFDIDGTLLLSGGAGQLAMEQTLTDEFSMQPPFTGVRTAGRTDFGIVTELLDRYAIPRTDEQRQRFRCAYLERLPACLQSLSGTVLPGVVRLLDSLAACDNVTLALLTGNYSEAAWIKLRHFGLDHHFEMGGFGDHHAKRDDVARLARQAALLGLADDNTSLSSCVIGDTPADIQCARAIDASVVAVATGSFSQQELQIHEPDHVFADLSDHAAVSKALMGP